MPGKSVLGSRGFLPLLAPPVLLVLLIVIIAVVIVGPAVLISVSPELMILFQIAASIMIVSWVRQIVGPGTLSLVISAVLVYIFVFILPQLTIGLWALYTFMGLGVWTILFWGLTIFSRRGA